MYRQVLNGPIITAKFHDKKMTFSRNCLSASWLYFSTLVHCFAKFIKYFCCLAVSITLILLADSWTMKSCYNQVFKRIEKLSSIFAKNFNFLQLCRNYKTSLTRDRNLNHFLVCTGPIRHILKMQPNLDFSISKIELFF